MVKTKTFEEFLEDKFMDLREIGGRAITKDNYEDLYSSWSEQLDVQELIDFGQEYGDYRDMPDYGDIKENVIAGVDFKEPLDSLESITGSKLSDMLGK